MWMMFEGQYCFFVNLQVTWELTTSFSSVCVLGTLKYSNSFNRDTSKKSTTWKNSLTSQRSPKVSGTSTKIINWQALLEKVLRRKFRLSFSSLQTVGFTMLSSTCRHCKMAQTSPVLYFFLYFKNFCLVRQNLHASGSLNRGGWCLLRLFRRCR